MKMCCRFGIFGPGKLGENSFKSPGKVLEFFWAHVLEDPDDYNAMGCSLVPDVTQSSTIANQILIGQGN